MWMGGMLPLGYDLVDKRLVINPSEAKLVASIFKRYQACPSISALVADLDARGVMTKSWLTKKGEKRGGLPWQKKTVAYVLANPIYLGIAVHKGLHHKGQHEAIVDQALFDDVQAKASEKSATAKAAAVVRAQSVSGLLRGLLYGLEGYVFSPTFTSKGTKEYRYYVNQLAIKRSSADCEVARVPAGLADQLVVDEVRAILQNPSLFNTALRAADELDSDAPALHPDAGLEAIDAAWDEMPSSERAMVIQAMIERIEVRPDALVIRWKEGGVADLFATAHGARQSAKGVHICLANTVIALQSRGRTPERRTQLVKANAPLPDPTMLRLLARAEALNRTFEARGISSFDKLAVEAKLDRSYATRLSRLANLSPRIKCSIIAGKQPPSLLGRDLMRWPFPDSWASQEKKFFSGSLQ
jgi:hypothetical protein